MRHGRGSSVRAHREDVARLAAEHLAQSGEGGEPDRAGPVVLEHREVDDGHTDAVGELGQGHPPRGQQIVNDSFLLLVHAGDQPLRFVLPPRPWAQDYVLVLDTTDDRPVGGDLFGPGQPLPMTPRSVVLLRAQRPVRPS